MIHTGVRGVFWRVSAFSNRSFFRGALKGASKNASFAPWLRCVWSRNPHVLVCTLRFLAHPRLARKQNPLLFETPSCRENLRDALLYRFRRRAGIGSLSDGPAHHDVVGAVLEGLLHSDGALLIVVRPVFHRADAGRH